MVKVKPYRTIKVTSNGKNKNLKPAGLTILKCYTGFRTVLLGLTIVKEKSYLNKKLFKQKCNCLIEHKNFTTVYHTWKTNKTIKTHFNLSNFDDLILTDINILIDT